MLPVHATMKFMLYFLLAKFNYLVHPSVSYVHNLYNISASHHDEKSAQRMTLNGM